MPGGGGHAAKARNNNGTSRRMRTATIAGPRRATKLGVRLAGGRSMRRGVRARDVAFALGAGAGAARARRGQAHREGRPLADTRLHFDAPARVLDDAL